MSRLHYLVAVNVAVFFAVLSGCPARAVDAFVAGALHQIVIQGHPTTGLPVINESTLSGIGIAPINRSGTVTLGGTAQQLMAANLVRRGFMLQNISAGPLWINELGATAVQGQPSIQVAAGATYTSPPNATSPAAVSIIGATTAQAFVAREW